MKDDGGFEHNLQSLRVVDCLEKRYVRYDGLNLCYETREGIALHQTTHDHPSPLEEFARFNRPSLEAQAVNIADPLAYCAHDLEDALNAGFLAIDDIRGMGIPLVDRILGTCEKKYHQFKGLGTILQARLLVRTLIEEANILVMEETSKNLNHYKIHTPRRRAGSTGTWWRRRRSAADFDALKAYLFDNVYKRPQVWIMNEKASSLSAHLRSSREEL
jgi:dGTPase